MDLRYDGCLSCTSENLPRRCTLIPSLVYSSRSSYSVSFLFPTVTGIIGHCCIGTRFTVAVATHSRKSISPPTSTTAFPNLVSAHRAIPIQKTTISRPITTRRTLAFDYSSGRDKISVCICYHVFINRLPLHSPISIHNHLRYAVSHSPPEKSMTY